jgi:hypothetical protein
VLAGAAAGGCDSRHKAVMNRENKTRMFGTYPQL